VRRTDLVAFAAGLVFAIGLGVAGMTQPPKVLAFLDVAGAWDPSLAFVMVSAIGVLKNDRSRNAAPTVTAVSASNRR